MTGFVVLTALLLMVSLLATAYYSTSTATLAAKDKEVADLRLALALQNETIYGLKLNIIILNSSMAALNQKVASLEGDQNASSAEISSLASQILRLRNQSAFLNLELSVAEQAGNFTIIPYYDNRTMTVQPSTTVQVASNSRASTGTIAFVSPSGCSSVGTDTAPGTSTVAFEVLLSSNGSSLLSSYHRVSGEPFTFSLKNVGPAPVSCTFSLFYVTQ